MSESTQALRDGLLEALALKDVRRAGWVRAGVPQPESVAAHSWGLAFLVLTLCPPRVDRARALAMAIVHDLAEVRVGDLTPHDPVGPQEKAALEASAMEKMTEPLGERASELASLWREYEAGESAEARFVKACDKLDMALQAQRYRDAHGVDTQEFVQSALAKLPEGVLKELAEPVER